MSHFKIFMIILVFILFLFANMVLSYAGEVLDLSTPTATIRTYCNSSNINIVQQCFHPNMKIGKKMAKRIWSERRIINGKPTDMIGERLVVTKGTVLIIDKDDIEIVMEAKMIHPKKGNPTTRFWYLLRNINGEWKIVSYSHIADKYYPAYD